MSAGCPFSHTAKLVPPNIYVFSPAAYVWVDRIPHKKNLWYVHLSCLHGQTWFSPTYISSSADHSVRVPPSILRSVISYILCAASTVGSSGCRRKVKEKQGIAPRLRCHTPNLKLKGGASQAGCHRKARKRGTTPIAMQKGERENTRDRSSMLIHLDA